MLIMNLRAHPINRWQIIILNKLTLVLGLHFVAHSHRLYDNITDLFASTTQSGVAESWKALLWYNQLDTKRTKQVNAKYKKPVRTESEVQETNQKWTRSTRNQSEVNAKYRKPIRTRFVIHLSRVHNKTNLWANLSD